MKFFHKHLGGRQLQQHLDCGTATQRCIYHSLIFSSSVSPTSSNQCSSNPLQKRKRKKPFPIPLLVLLLLIYKYVSPCVHLLLRCATAFPEAKNALCNKNALCDSRCVFLKKWVFFPHISVYKGNKQKSVTIITGREVIKPNCSSAFLRQNVGAPPKLIKGEKEQQL